MSFSISPNFTQRTYTWTNWKLSLNTKRFTYQYDVDNEKYTIWGYDGPEVHFCLIWTGVMGYSFDGYYTQEQNDIDKTDFETNYKPFANKAIVPKSQITLGYTTSSGSSLTVIRATAYTEQTTNAQRSLVSSSASDGYPSGIGARTIKITYYDQTLLGPFTECVNLNGTSSVNTVNTNICFIEKMEVYTVGSQLSNVGTITLKAATGGGGATIGTIAAGDGTTNWCHHYVPLNTTMSLVSVIGTIKGMDNGAIEVHRTIPTDITKTEFTISPKVRIMAGSTDKLLFDVPITVVGPALVVVYGRSDGSSGNIDWSVGMGYYEG